MPLQHTFHKTRPVYVIFGTEATLGLSNTVLLRILISLTINVLSSGTLSETLNGRFFWCFTTEPPRLSRLSRGLCRGGADRRRYQLNLSVTSLSHWASTWLQHIDRDAERGAVRLQYWKLVSIEAKSSYWTTYDISTHVVKFYLPRQLLKQPDLSLH